MNFAFYDINYTFAIDYNPSIDYTPAIEDSFAIDFKPIEEFLTGLIEEVNKTDDFSKL